MGILNHLTCLLRNLYSSQEATVRTRRETTDWFKIGKGVHQGCALSPFLFNLYEEYRASLVAQLVKKLPSVPKTWVQSLGQEDPLEKGMVTHFSILAWKIPLTEEPGGQHTIHGVTRVGHDLVTKSPPWEMPSWMKHKLESRLLGKILITSDMQMTPL